MHNSVRRSAVALVFAAWAAAAGGCDSKGRGSQRAGGARDGGADRGGAGGLAGSGGTGAMGGGGGASLGGDAMAGAGGTIGDGSVSDGSRPGGSGGGTAGAGGTGGTGGTGGAGGATGMGGSGGAGGSSPTTDAPVGGNDGGVDAPADQAGNDGPGAVDAPVASPDAAADVPATPDATTPADRAMPDTMPAVQLTDVAPSAVSRQLTMNVDLVGSGFAAGASVRLQSCTTSGTTYDFAPTVGAPSSARIVLAADSTRAQGLYTVTFTNADGTSDSLDCGLRIVDASPPTVTNVVPASAYQGAAGDGVNSDQTVQITGTGFSPTPRVRFRSVSNPSDMYDAISVTWLSPAQLAAVAPSETRRMPVGDYHVLVENPNLLAGQWYTDGAMTVPGIFKVTSVPPPRIDSIDPVRCPVSNPVAPCPTVTATGDHFQPGARYALRVPTGMICPAGWTKATGTTGEECTTAAVSRPDQQHVAANTSGFPIGVYPIKVTNPDGQFDVFYSFLVTDASSGHLNAPFAPVAAALNEGRWRHAADYAFDDFGNSYIYVAGGQKGASDAPLDSVEVSSIGITGTPAPWALARQWKPTRDPGNTRGLNTLASGRTGLTMVHVGPYLYAIGGALASTNPSTPTITDANKTDASNTVERARVLGYETMPRRHLPTATGTVGLPRGTWYYRVSAVSSEGESLPSLPMQLTGGRGQIRVCWSPPPLAGLTYRYNVYRSVAADGRANTERLLAAEVDGPCHLDDGFGPNQPAPGRLSGTDVATPAGQPGLALGAWTYRVSATTNGTETLAGYPATVTLTTAGRQAVQLSWDPIFGATYNVYRVPSAGGASGTEVLVASGLTSATHVDGGSAAPGTAKPNDGIAPLPPGSLTRWQPAPKQGGGIANLVQPREGADAIVASITDGQGRPRTFIFVAGGRANNKTGLAYGPGDGADNNYHKTIERTEVYADGTLSDFAVEAQKFTHPRAFFPLLTTEGSDSTPTAPPPKEPPCEDLDGDGFFACSCFKPQASCMAGIKTPACAPDCNDLDKTVHPGATEICGDGRDQDCDGNVCDYSAGICSACGGTDQMCPSGVDAGTTPPDAGGGSGPVMPPGCTPRDEDGDGYMSCQCFAPPASCAADDPGPTCAADCCDRPGDRGCPGSVTTLAQARLINPGEFDENCDGIDNNCTIDNDYFQPRQLTCGPGTDMCFVAAAPAMTPARPPFLDAFDGTFGFRRAPVVQSLAAAAPGVSRPDIVLAHAPGAPVWLLACQGDQSYEAGGTGNRGSIDFEACTVSPVDGHLTDCSTSLPGSLWVVQNSSLPSGQTSLGHEAALYFDYLFPFRGVSQEYLGSFATPRVASGSRFPLDATAADPARLVGGIESSGATFTTARAYYQLVRLNSYLYVIGGTNGSTALGTMEHRLQ